MFLFRKHKKLSHKQVVIVGFVLGVMSILATAVMVTIMPMLDELIYNNALYNMEMFLLLFIAVFYLAVQGVILFGFPMYYAQDKKCHMTGLQILVYALLWELLLMAFVLVFSVALTA